MNRADRFIHNFPSCSRTYATLCIYHASADPQEVTAILKIKPDSSQKVGELIRRGKKATVSGWFLGTKDVLKSKDVRAHIEGLLDKISKKKKELEKLRATGYEMRISCFWESASGNGGPILDHEFMKRLSEFPFELHFDIWFDCSKI